MEQQDQADRLRRVTQKQEETIMVSQLPSRSEYHKKKREEAKKKRKKNKNPLIKILAVIFLLLPIVIGLLYYFQVLNFHENPVEKSDNFDHVEFEK